MSSSKALGKHSRESSTSTSNDDNKDESWSPIPEKRKNNAARERKKGQRIQNFRTGKKLGALNLDDSEEEPNEDETEDEEGKTDHLLPMN